MSRDPFDIWQRATRRALRDRVRDAGEIPSLYAAVSVGANPRALRGLARLDLMPDQLAVKGRIQEAVGAHLSRFAAFGALVAHPDLEAAENGWHVFMLTCLTLDRVALWQTAAHTVDGLVAWEPGNFRAGDFTFVQKSIADNAAVAL